MKIHKIHKKIKYIQNFHLETKYINYQFTNSNMKQTSMEFNYFQVSQVKDSKKYKLKPYILCLYIHLHISLIILISHIYIPRNSFIIKNSIQSAYKNSFLSSQPKSIGFYSPLTSHKLNNFNYKLQFTIIQKKTLISLIH